MQSRSRIDCNLEMIAMKGWYPVCLTLRQRHFCRHCIYWIEWMALDSLHELYVEELKDLYNAKNQL